LDAVKVWEKWPVELVFAVPSYVQDAAPLAAK
jgi:hypothetical protein